MSSAVPEGWKQKVVGDVVTLQYGKSPKDIFDDDGEYPVIGTGGITGYANTYLHEGETTVIGRKGTINKPSYISGKFWAIDTTYYAERYREADPRWFFYTLQDTDLTRYNEASGVPSLNRDTLYSISVKFPPLPEQKKIASILISVDQAIEKIESQIAKLQDLKTGMMQELLTKGIGHTEFKDSPVGSIPVGWDCLLLDAVAKRGSGHTPSKSHSEYWNGGIQWVSLADSSRLDKLYISETDKEISQLGIENSSAVMHPTGTVILSRDAGIGKSAILSSNMAVSQHFIAWRCGPRLDNYFLYYLLQHWKPRFEAIAMGSTIQTIGLSYFKKLHVPVPPVDEQKKISKSLLSVENTKFLLEKKLVHLKAVKKALMQDLLTGKIRVRTD